MGTTRVSFYEMSVEFAPISNFHIVQNTLDELATICNFQFPQFPRKNGRLSSSSFLTLSSLKTLYVLFSLISNFQFTLGSLLSQKSPTTMYWREIPTLFSHTHGGSWCCMERKIPSSPSLVSLQRHALVLIETHCIQNEPLRSGRSRGRSSQMWTHN